MAQDMRKVLENLDDLLALDIDAVNAYETAIRRIKVPYLRERLGEFMTDHERHIRDLAEWITRLGGEPRDRPDIKGFVLKGFTAITAAMGDEAALKAMLRNEELTNRTYRRALDETWTAEVRELIERNYADERRHLAFIQDALQNRIWEQGEPLQP